MKTKPKVDSAMKKKPTYFGFFAAFSVPRSFFDNLDFGSAVKKKPNILEGFFTEDPV